MFDKIDAFMIDCYVAWQIGLRRAANKLFKDERGAVDIVAIVVMIAIAVLLAVLFRKRIKELLDSLFETISSKASEATSDM